MEKTNWIVALVVGALVGFFVGHYTAPGGSNGPTQVGPVAMGEGAARPMPSGPNPDLGKTPNDLPPSYIKEAEFPAGTFAGLTDQQKYTVLKVANEKNCTCGCPNDSIAKCRTHDASCTTAPSLLNDIIGDAKRGMNSMQIVAKMNGGNKPAPGRPVDDSNVVYKVPAEESPVRGNKDAKVTVVAVSFIQ